MSKSGFFQTNGTTLLKDTKKGRCQALCENHATLETVYGTAG